MYSLQKIIPLILIIKPSLFKEYLMKPEYSAIKEKHFMSYPLLVYLLLNKHPKWTFSKWDNSIIFSSATEACISLLYFTYIDIFAEEEHFKANRYMLCSDSSNIFYLFIIA